MSLLDLRSVVILQPENPDGDSVASALALEEILGDAGIETVLYSYVQIPTYLSYIEGHDRISQDTPSSFDGAIIVDTSSVSLLERTLELFMPLLQKKPVYVFDHHATESTLLLPNITYMADSLDAVATGELIYNFAVNNHLIVNASAATHIAESILADTLGLTTTQVSTRTFSLMAKLTELGANVAAIDKKRRLAGQKPPEILTYKGSLLQRISYFQDNKVAVVTIPHSEIVTFSPLYNPAALVLEDIRQVQGVEVAIVYKTYNDGKITAKIRSYNLPIARKLAENFGGGGHDFAAGFKLLSGDIEETKSQVLAFLASHLLQ